MKKMNNKGFTLIELIVVIAIIAILAAVAVPSYNRIQDRAERSAALSNAQVIVNCVNAHNAVADTDDAITLITGAADADGMVTLSDALAAALGTPDAFNVACENQISGMSLEDYGIALQYVSLLGTDGDEFGLKEGYDHTVTVPAT